MAFGLRTWVRLGPPFGLDALCRRKLRAPTVCIGGRIFSTAVGVVGEREKNGDNEQGLCTMGMYSKLVAFCDYVDEGLRRG